MSRMCRRVPRTEAGREERRKQMIAWAQSYVLAARELMHSVRAEQQRKGNEHGEET